MEYKYPYFCRIIKILALNKKIFVIIVTYNGSKWIEKCISSVLKSSYPIDIIVIDNNSSDISVQIIKQFQEVHLIESDENLGFGKANNLGIDLALQKNADYVFLLNQDTWIFEDTISNLVCVAENNPNFGILSPLHFSGDGVNLDESFKTYYHRKIETGDNQNSPIVPFVNAAAWLVTKTCLEKVGQFESMFSHYGEDRNFCDRVLYHNFKIAIVQNSKICHDRAVNRNFKKDSIQSKYSILSKVLNINHSLFVAYLNASKSVVGLPKFFSNHYSVIKISNLFFKLMFYYIALVFSVSVILKKRQSFK